MQLKQPIVGTVATVIGISLSLGFISLFDFPTFAGWISYFLLCVIPVQTILAITLGTNHPNFASRRAQPAMRILLVGSDWAGRGRRQAAVAFQTIGGGISPPTPMLVMYAIVTVVTTFWAAIMLGGWPAASLVKNPWQLASESY